MKTKCRIKLRPVHRWFPVTFAEIRPSQQGSLSTGEDEVALGRALQMEAQLLGQEGRDRERAPGGARLRLFDVARATFDLLERADDPHLALQEIEVVLLEANQLAPPASEVDGRVDEGAESRIDHLGEPFDLIRCEVALLLMRNARREMLRQGDSGMSRASTASLNTPWSRR